jgi:hypothetical protein
MLIFLKNLARKKVDHGSSPDNHQHHDHPLVELDRLRFESDPHHQKENYYRKKVAKHLKKKRTHHVVFFDLEGNSIHSEESFEQLTDDIGIDPHNKESTHKEEHEKKPSSLEVSTSEEIPEIETVPVQEILNHEEKLVHPDKDD